MEKIHFSTNGQVGINFCAEEQNNGDLLLLRCYQSVTQPQPPELFTIKAAERHGLMEYLNKTMS